MNRPSVRIDGWRATPRSRRLFTRSNGQFLGRVVIPVDAVMPGYAIGLGSFNDAYRAVGRRGTAPNRITIINCRGFCGKTLRTLRADTVLCTVFFSGVGNSHAAGHIHTAPAVSRCWSGCRSRTGSALRHRCTDLRGATRRPVRHQTDEEADVVSRLGAADDYCYCCRLAICQRRREI
jgi:hypothetical protein